MGAYSLTPAARDSWLGQSQSFRLGRHTELGPCIVMTIAAPLPAKAAHLSIDVRRDKATLTQQSACLYKVHSPSWRRVKKIARQQLVQDALHLLSIVGRRLLDSVSCQQREALKLGVSTCHEIGKFRHRYLMTEIRICSLTFGPGKRAPRLAPSYQLE